MDTFELLFAGKPIRRENIQLLGVEYQYDRDTGFDWVVRCRVYGKPALSEPQPTLRDAMARLHQLTAPSE